VRWTTACAIVLGLAEALQSGSEPRIRVAPLDYASRVDVTVDGRPFTSYVHLSSMRVPSLTPIHDSEGAAAQSFAFGHGDVNGIDFLRADGKGTGRSAGRIVLRRIIETVSSDTEGRLSLETDWVAPDGALVLKEHTWFTFRADGARRTIDRTTRLSAVRGRVVLAAETEPALAVLLPEAAAGTRARVLTGAGGDDANRPAPTPWVAVTGARSTVAVFDHPGNPGAPAAGAASTRRLAFTPAASIEIDAGASRTFFYRLLLDGGALSAAAIAAEYEAFTRR
jgi:hypothetical protein